VHELAVKYEAMVMVDECHATGFIGKTGRGTIEHCNVIGKMDIITGTLGKALGGASGGFTSGRKEIIELLRQRSRPYLFSNTLMPSIVSASLKVLEILSQSTDLRDKLETNTQLFRSEMKAAGFDILEGIHPITPVMLYDAKLAQTFAEELLAEGIYVIGFFYPVVPKGKARIRVQISAGHSTQNIKDCVAAFTKVGKKLGVI
jgi:glycine C-acetyltransferase